jgi:hypothetical protein
MSAATLSAMHFENTPKTLEPVSKITGSFWRGVPIETLTKYCVFSWFTTGTVSLATGVR